MGEGDLSGTKSNIKEWNIEEDSDESSFEEKSEVTEVVDHELLGKGKVSSLANHKISPLDAHNRDEISGLSILKSFNGVANWPVFGVVRVFIEIGVVFDIGMWAPSAGSPGIGISN